MSTMNKAFLLKALSKLPLNILYLFGSIMYLVYYYILRYRKDIALNNLRNSFPDKNHQEIKKLLKHSYKNLAQFIAEAIKTISISEDELANRVKIVNQDILDNFANSGQSVVLLAAHQCNWEWLLLASCLKLPFDIAAAYKPQPDEPLDKLMQEARSRFRGTLIPVKKFIMEVAKRKSAQRAFTIVADQTPHRGEEKYWTTFLNQDTAFFVGPQKIAWITNAPVVFMGMKRVRRGHYEVELKILAQPPYIKDGYEIIDRYVKEVEKQILKYPADWFWQYRKWPYKKPLYAD